MLEKHDKLEKNSILMLVLVIIVISIGGLVEITPLFRLETVIEPVDGVRPYTPLELAGQKIYFREGCYNCHSQQIRPLRDEVERYGHYSLAAESMYDHPFQWGSKRTGPDLARIGGKYSNEWHAKHLADPRSMVPESIMPRYDFLLHREAAYQAIYQDMGVLKTIGVPYTDEMINNAYGDIRGQVGLDDYIDGLTSRYHNVTIADFDDNPEMISEMDALIAYLQVLGTMVDFKTYEGSK